MTMSGYAKRVAALQTPEVRQRISDGIKRSKARETPEQRALHNARIAVAYRQSVVNRVYSKDMKFTQQHKLIAWVKVAEDRLAVLENQGEDNV
jgi:hypothetical protein